jgi:hypothetical protein
LIPGELDSASPISRDRPGSSRSAYRHPAIQSLSRSPYRTPNRAPDPG